MYREGVIALSGGYRGPSGTMYLQSFEADAVQFLDDMYSIYKDNFYIEVSRQRIEEEERTEPFFVKYALDKGVPIVATNEAFFISRDKHAAQEILMCINDGTYIVEERRRKTSEHCYLKTSEEMNDLFRDLPEAIINTSVIAKRCSYMPEQHPPMLPRFDDGSGKQENDILHERALEGLKKRLTNKAVTEDEYLKRFEYEYSVIKSMGFSGYFLIVSDFVQWAKDNDIPVGPGRGSGAGSLIAWSLSITDLDPIQYSLIFERFLNPDRVSMPDFDIDFCQNRRDEVIRYVRQKYGTNRVAHIIALGKLQARAVLRDVGRVLQIPYGKVDKICKLVPYNAVHPVDLQKALEIEPTLNNMMQEDESVDFLIKTGLELEGLYRHASVHAAGVVIGNRPVDEIVPVYNDGESDIAITQFNMKFVEKAGLVKFDFLGLKTLTIIKQICDLVGSLNISSIPLDDQRTFDLLREVNVVGVFQLDSTGMKDVIRKLKPDRLEDLIALVSLYRPGPMDDIPKYLARKHGQEPIEYLHPCLEEILSTTYGVMVYQEQVMKIAQVMGGFTLAASDLLRRAMGKKNVAEMNRQKKVFLRGAHERGIDENTAIAVFALMEKFAGYGFNRSHAAPYALLTYQTAYLKANYPLEFYVSAMNLEIANTDKIAVFVQDARNNGLKILPPSINSSETTFKKENGAIRYALGALKGGSIVSLDEVIAERQKKGKFRSLQDFAQREKLNKKQIEVLAMSGALDDINTNRNQSIQYLMKNSGGLTKAGAETIQKSLFANLADIADDLPNTQDWQRIERLAKERSVIGFYLSDHPMDIYRQFVGNSESIVKSGKFKDMAGANVKAAGILLNKHERLSRQGQKYAFITISDQDNDFEVSVLPNIYNDVADILKIGNALLMDVLLKETDGIVKVIANSISNIEHIISHQRTYIIVGEETDIDKLQNLLESIEDGENPISFIIQPSGSIRKTEIETRYKKHMSIENRIKLKTIKGIEFY
jgi:DNA polymerase-3 subunit alpha